MKFIINQKKQNSYKKINYLNLDLFLYNLIVICKK